MFCPNMCNLNFLYKKKINKSPSSINTCIASAAERFQPQKESSDQNVDDGENHKIK